MICCWGFCYNRNWTFLKRKRKQQQTKRRAQKSAMLQSPRQPPTPNDKTVKQKVAGLFSHHSNWATLLHCIVGTAAAKYCFVPHASCLLLQDDSFWYRTTYNQCTACVPLNRRDLQQRDSFVKARKALYVITARCCPATRELFKQLLQDQLYLQGKSSLSSNCDANRMLSCRRCAQSASCHAQGPKSPSWNASLKPEQSRS